MAPAFPRKDRLRAFRGALATYAKSLTYKDLEDSRRSLEALAKAFAPSRVVQNAAA